MSRKRLSDIRPENIGELFLKPGEDVPYRLLGCDTEPRALMARVTDINVPNVPGVPLSEYRDFVLLKPVHPVEAPKKPRADVGKKHNKKTEPFIPSYKGETGNEVSGVGQDDLTKRVLKGTVLE